jgi:hypothetical protein
MQRCLKACEDLSMEVRSHFGNVKLDPVAIKWHDKAPKCVLKASTSDDVRTVSNCWALLCPRLDAG